MIFNNNHVCNYCEQKAERKNYSIHYCVKHYREKVFGTDDLIKFLDKNNIKYMESAVSSDIIINGMNQHVIQFCVEFELDYWISGCRDEPRAIHIAREE